MSASKEIYGFNRSLILLCIGFCATIGVSFVLFGIVIPYASMMTGIVGVSVVCLTLSVIYMISRYHAEKTILYITANVFKMLEEEKHK